MTNFHFLQILFFDLVKLVSSHLLLLYKLKYSLKYLLNRFSNAKEALHENLIKKINDFRQQIKNNVTILENASPQTILNRGYSMVTDTNGKIITDSASVTAGQDLIISPAKGKITATVK